jgi:hypothetical protein
MDCKATYRRDQLLFGKPAGELSEDVYGDNWRVRGRLCRLLASATAGGQRNYGLTHYLLFRQRVKVPRGGSPYRQQPQY